MKAHDIAKMKSNERSTAMKTVNAGPIGMIPALVRMGRGASGGLTVVGVPLWVHFPGFVPPGRACLGGTALSVKEAAEGGLMRPVVERKE